MKSLCIVGLSKMSNIIAQMYTFLCYSVKWDVHRCARHGNTTQSVWEKTVWFCCSFGEEVGEVVEAVF
ncbi:hypothetical protein ACH3XW_21390 [Acanthocheilonema viteae]